MLHARYSRDEVRAAFGVTEPVREGVKWVEAEQADLFFVTLNKTVEHYSPHHHVRGPGHYTGAVPVGIAEHHVDGVIDRAAVRTPRFPWFVRAPVPPGEQGERR
jgi:hypothetical protein